MKPAIIEVLWIGEMRPDRFSKLIQFYLKKNYSHNAFVFRNTGRLWHATTPGGVKDEDFFDAMKGCVIRAAKEVTLDVSEDFFAGWLEGERGKGYAHAQNFGLLAPIIQPFVGDGAQRRNCSEFVARALQFSKEWKPQFPVNTDWITPAHTYKILKPE